MYAFLLWNLFLAWIPYWLSLFLQRKYREAPKKAGFFVATFVWLLFFPNALYIITDFIHLRPRGITPLWFDLILILSFAWTGLLLGFVSLQTVHEIVARHWNAMTGWLFAFAVLFLSSFGIYIGRFLRWNSWDIVFNPVALLSDMFDRVLNPLIHPRTYGMTLMLFLFFSVAYVTVIRLRLHRPSPK